MGQQVTAPVDTEPGLLLVVSVLGAVKAQLGDIRQALFQRNPSAYYTAPNFCELYSQPITP